MGGDVDVAAVAALMAEPARARMLLALDRDRALPASVLAAESGVAASTASGHLARLLDAGFLSVEEHGRHRYYRLAEPAVAEVLETMARLAPTTEIRSLRQGTRAEALRRARSCYDHLAGRAGTAVMAALLDRGWLAGGDGRFHADASGRDRPSAPGWDVDYRLTPAGLAGFRSLGIDPEALSRIEKVLVELKGREVGPEDYETSLRADMDLHGLIVEATGNGMLAQVLEMLNERVVQVRVVTSPPRFQHSVDEHLAIVAALRARDADGAAEAMRQHLANARENLVFLT